MGGKPRSEMSPEELAARRQRVRDYSRAARERIAADPERAEAIREADRLRQAKRRAAAPSKPKPRPPAAHELTGETWLQRKVRINRERRQRVRELFPGLHAARLAAEAKRTCRENDPEGHARRMERQRLRRGTSGSWLARSQPSGSVLATSAPSQWRDVLAEINRAVPRWDDRDEVIAEAALLVLEGLSVAEAVAGAKRSVARSAAPYRQMRQIEDCHWL